MASPFKRRKRSLVYRVWIYRRLIGAAVVLGVILWFILINHTDVTVYFPFGLGAWPSKLGVVILLSAGLGGLAAALGGGLLWGLHRLRRRSAAPPGDEPTEVLDERPPSDYAAKATEGFNEARWNFDNEP